MKLVTWFVSFPTEYVRRRKLDPSDVQITSNVDARPGDLIFDRGMVSAQTDALNVANGCGSLLLDSYERIIVQSRFVPG